MSDSVAQRPLIELAALLAADASLNDEVVLALDDPPGYLAQFAERLSERGIERVRPDLAWFALLDGLKARARAAELDWKSSARDVLFGLKTLANLPRDAWDGYREECERKVDPDEDPFLECYLQIADLRVRPHGLAVLTLDSGGDSYVVVLLETPKVERAIQLASEVGLGTIVHQRGTEHVGSRGGE